MAQPGCRLPCCCRTGAGICAGHAAGPAILPFPTLPCSSQGCQQRGVGAARQGRTASGGLAPSAHMPPRPPPDFAPSACADPGGQQDGHPRAHRHDGPVAPPGAQRHQDQRRHLHHQRPLLLLRRAPHLRALARSWRLPLSGLHPQGMPCSGAQRTCRARHCTATAAARTGGGRRPPSQKRRAGASPARAQASFLTGLQPAS
jgi:hypothetical protein